ncbi:hypothetical protein ACJMK2_013854 [Sinanodonta woodiana]|uniref:Uncharacterized protein n=1 Tax=Sinanodonta woodiana TaxID=1069815 RepID=A0ABD3V230_SINWO
MNAKDLRSWSPDYWQHTSTYGAKYAVYVEMLNMFNTAILLELVPVQFCGDGTFLYTCSSRLLTGSEYFYELLRQRIAI